MKTEAFTEDVVRAVIRRELPLSALEAVGIHLQVHSDIDRGDERRFTIESASHVRIAPMPIDLATGLLASGNDSEEFKDWAAFLLSATEIIDLEPLENWPEGDQLLNGLWDASFEGVLTDDTKQVALALTD